MIRCVELFSGNGDISNYLNSLPGVTCLSVDYDPLKHAALCADVYSLSDEFLKQFDFIWLSPDCTTYSVAAGALHRFKGGAAKSDYAKWCDDHNKELISRLCKLDIPFICENPRGHFRNRDFVSFLWRRTVFYSTYGMDYEKPTDLFTNYPDLLFYFDTSFNPGVSCLNNQSGFLKRCKMPSRLIEDIGTSILCFLEDFYA